MLCVFSKMTLTFEPSRVPRCNSSTKSFIVCTFYLQATVYVSVKLLEFGFELSPAVLFKIFFERMKVSTNSLAVLSLCFKLEFFKSRAAFLCWNNFGCGRRFWLLQQSFMDGTNIYKDRTKEQLQRVTFWMLAKNCNIDASKHAFRLPTLWTFDKKGRKGLHIEWVESENILTVAWLSMGICYIYTRILRAAFVYIYLFRFLKVAYNGNRNTQLIHGSWTNDSKMAFEDVRRLSFKQTFRGKSNTARFSLTSHTLCRLFCVTSKFVQRVHKARVSFSLSHKNFTLRYFTAESLLLNDATFM